MPTTANQQGPYPASSDAPNGPSAFQSLAQWIEKKAVQVFSSITDRTTRMGSPTEGMVSWLQDKNRFDYHTGVAWVGWPRVDTFPVNITLFAPGVTTGSLVNSSQRTITMPAGYSGLNIRVRVDAHATYMQASGASAQKVALAARVNSTNGSTQESSTSASGVTERHLSAEVSTAIDAAASFTVGVAGQHAVSNGGTFERVVVHVTVEAPRRISPDVYTGHDGAA